MDTVAVHSESDGDEPDGGDADMVVESFGALTAALMGMQPPDPETRR